MSVPKSKRSEPKCLAVLKASKLAEYTIVITGNDKTFDITYKALTDDIVHCAERIFIECYTANNVYVNSKEKRFIRLNHQRSAISECKSLLALIQLAYEYNHLSSKRVEYWSGLVTDTVSQIKAWHKADAERYKVYK